MRRPVLSILRFSWPALVGWLVAVGNAWTRWSIDSGRVPPWPGSWAYHAGLVAFAVCTVGTLWPRPAERFGCVLVALNVSALAALLFTTVVVT